jgi:hypothetical protein
MTDAGTLKQILWCSDEAETEECTGRDRMNMRSLNYILVINKYLNN